MFDLWGYRRAGHNESDEPAFTQPLMYKSISEQPTTRALYAQQLEDEGVIPQGGGDRMVEEFQALLEQEFEAARSYKPNKADWLEGRWADLGMAGDEEARRGKTGGQHGPPARSRPCDLGTAGGLQRELENPSPAQEQAEDDR